ncbi:MAG: HAMP domain-containing histidine kinase [Candidatus Gastranaerophilales bacterium]|nr:HAMP domain-containing histidine kinase [Candidatus Gastranaerophilales bacterium]
MTKQDDFISTVSHELRTPLTSIRGFAQTMLVSWDKLDDNSKKKFLKIIEQQSNRLIHLVENILSVTKIPDEIIILKKTFVNQSVNTVIQIMKQKYPDYEFKLDLNIKNPAISADSEKLQQILINIVENACKYSETGSNVFVSTDENDKHVLIKIRDTGIGIDEKYAETVFEKFSRIDNPLTRKTQGSGLGLYITKSLTEKMNGAISFKNLDKGTEFTIKFPHYNIEEHLKCSVTH